MKKILVFALAVLSLVACKKNEEEKAAEALALNKTSISLKIGATFQLTANIAVDAWASSNESVATVANGLVTAVAEGSAIISATAGSETKTCVVAVTKETTPGPQPGPSGVQIQAKHIWPIVLDGVTAEANASIMVADFRPDNDEKNLWVWDESYQGGNATGKNFFGNNEGYLSLITATPNYGGAGFNLANGCKALAAATDLRHAIVENPDKYALHMAIKSTDSQNVSFYYMGSEGTYFTIGSAATSYSSNVIGNYDRDGQWHEFIIEMSAYAEALSGVVDGQEGNIFCMLAAGPAGSVLNLDAVYFYEKN